MLEILSMPGSKKYGIGSHSSEFTKLQWNCFTWAQKTKTAIRQKFVETQTMKVSFPINISKTDNYTQDFQKSLSRVIRMCEDNSNEVASITTSICSPHCSFLSQERPSWGRLTLTRHIPSCHRTAAWPFQGAQAHTLTSSHLHSIQQLLNLRKCNYLSVYHHPSAFLHLKIYFKSFPIVNDQSHLNSSRLIPTPLLLFCQWQVLSRGWETLSNWIQSFQSHIISRRIREIISSFLFTQMKHCTFTFQSVPRSLL